MQGGGCTLSQGTRRILQERQRHSLKASQAAAAMGASGLLNQVHIITISLLLCCAVLCCAVLCFAVLCCSMVCSVTKPVLFCINLHIGHRLAESLPKAVHKVCWAVQSDASLALASLPWCPL